MLSGAKVRAAPLLAPKGIDTMTRQNETHTMTAERRRDGGKPGLWFAVEEQLHGFSTREARDAWVAEQRATPMFEVEKLDL